MTKEPVHEAVSFDCMTLIWAIRRDGPEEAVTRAKWLFTSLNERAAQIILPSVVVAEFVTPLRTRAERSRTVAALSERFIIAEFDARDAILAAELWNQGKDRRKMAKPNARVLLRADTLIVATARNHGAQVFYTEDDNCFKMAEQLMDARRLPRVAPHLFADQELADEESA